MGIRVMRFSLPESEDVHVYALAKGCERYVLIFKESSRSEALRTVGRWAANEDLSWTWCDATTFAKTVQSSEEQS